MRRTIGVRKRTMQSAASATFPILTALVERATRRAGSKMHAYADVGREIGESASWVRKFLGRQPVRLDADTYLAIRDRYARECERWEAEADLQRARFLALGGGDDAMAQSAVGRVDVGAGRPVSRAGKVPAVVARVVGESGR